MKKLFRILKYLKTQSIPNLRRLWTDHITELMFYKIIIYCLLFFSSQNLYSQESEANILFPFTRYLELESLDSKVLVNNSDGYKILSNDSLKIQELDFVLPDISDVSSPSNIQLVSDSTIYFREGFHKVIFNTSTNTHSILPFNVSVYQYQYINESVVYGLDDGRDSLFKSNDGGLTFENVLTENIDKYHFYNEDSLFVLTSQKVLLISTNGGETWHEKPLDILANSSIFYSDGKLFVGDFGKMLVTSDLGISWNNAIEIPLEDLNDQFENIHINSNGYGAAASKSNLFITTDFGKNWELKNYLPALSQRTFDLFVSDANKLFVINSGTHSMTSIWQYDFQNNDWKTFLNNHYGYLKSFRHLEENDSYYCVHFLHETIDTMQVLKSTDGGYNWEPFFTLENASFNNWADWEIVNENLIYFYQQRNGKLVKSENGGFTWEIIFEENFDNNVINILEADNNSLFFSNFRDNYFVFSKNKGSTWDTISFNEDQEIYNITMSEIIDGTGYVTVYQSQNESYLIYFLENYSIVNLEEIDESNINPLSININQDSEIIFSDGDLQKSRTYSYNGFNNELQLIDSLDSGTFIGLDNSDSLWYYSPNYGFFVSDDSVENFDTIPLNFCLLYTSPSPRD